MLAVIIIIIIESPCLPWIRILLWDATVLRKPWMNSSALRTFQEPRIHEHNNHPPWATFWLRQALTIEWKPWITPEGLRPKCLYMSLIRDGVGGEGCACSGWACWMTADTILDFEIRSKVIMVPWLLKENRAHKERETLKMELEQ